MQYVTGGNLSLLNLLTGNRYGGPTALTLLAITLLLFHGLTSWSTCISRGSQSSSPSHFSQQ